MEKGIGRQVAELLADWPQEWKREKLNILVRRARRDYDSEPAVTVALRYSYTEVASARLPHKGWFDEAAINHLGQPGAFCSGATKADLDRAVATINAAVGRDLSVQNNCPEIIV